MSTDPNDLPDFVREALASADGAPVLSDVDAREALLLAELLPLPSAGQGPELRLGLDRLLQSASELPTRYAPFFGRIAEMWDLPEGEIEDILARSKDPANWHRPWLPGLQWIDVKGGTRSLGAVLQLIRFAPGMRFPKHSHSDRETLMVLSGSYLDSSGRTVGPGDVHTMETGSVHSFVVGKEEPCIAVANHAGPQFTGPIMRNLVKLLGGNRRSALG